MFLPKILSAQAVQCKVYPKVRDEEKPANILSYYGRFGWLFVILSIYYLRSMVFVNTIFDKNKSFVRNFQNLYFSRKFIGVVLTI